MHVPSVALKLESMASLHVSEKQDQLATKDEHLVQLTPTTLEISEQEK